MIAGTKHRRLRSNTDTEGQNNVTHLGTRFVQPEACKACSADHWRMLGSLRLQSNHLAADRAYAAAEHGSDTQGPRRDIGRLGSGFPMATKFVIGFVAGQKTATGLLPAL